MDSIGAIDEQSLAADIGEIARPPLARRDSSWAGPLSGADQPAVRVRPDHVFIALLLFVFAFSRGRLKTFAVDWTPWIVFWICYDMMRGVADNLRGAINVIVPYEVELAMFGKFFGGIIPCYVMQDWQQVMDGTFIKGLLDASGGLFYKPSTSVCRSCSAGYSGIPPATRKLFYYLCLEHDAAQFFCIDEFIL